MNERLKNLRKSLDLTQREFGERIGVKPNTIATYEIGRNEPIDAVVSLICREFNVSEMWLRTGEGDMFCNAPDTQIAQIVREYNLDDLDQRIVLGYLHLSESDRAAVKRLINSIAAPHLAAEVVSETETTTPIPDADGQGRTPVDTTEPERTETEKAEKKKMPILLGEDGLEAQKKQLMAFLDKMAPDQLQMYYDQMRRLKQPPTETLSPSALAGADKKVPESDPSNLA